MASLSGEAGERLALWERPLRPLAPLTERQRDSVAELREEALPCLPAPPELPIEDLISLGQPSLTVTLTATVPESTEDIIFKGFSALGLENERIETAQQFFSWFDQLGTQMDQDEGAKYRETRLYLSGFEEQCDTILSDVNSALQHLESLQKQYLFVSTKTGTLHEACEQLLKEQPDFRDYPVYLAKFKQCLSKAMHLMKTYTVHTLQNLTNQLMKRDPSVAPNSDNAFTLFYVKFRAAAPKVRALIEQIEQRSEKMPEYQQLLNEIHQCYLDQREHLLGPSITSTVTELTNRNNRDHCALQISKSLKEEEKRLPADTALSATKADDPKSYSVVKLDTLESSNLRLQTTISPADLHGMWYPTRAVFQGLSQEALSACIQSLLTAAESIAKNKGTPEIREHYIDSKKDVDRHLKFACEQFIQQQTKQLVEPLEEFLAKVLRF
ncbi:hypothetical protein JD844_031793 [Phrynosoma platyrhinos]|uniref:Conserved oligomeric Golgi complex subunit 3 n=1 Tax=Phrynosoma platyrhinos TaxID=52577 RepID=A0ABQ7T3T0_PHRPL|nr:hypothetical protein JD844_031793 [Phrynosoma platyrhinos]